MGLAGLARPGAAALFSLFFFFFFPSAFSSPFLFFFSSAKKNKAIGFVVLCGLLPGGVMVRAECGKEQLG